MERTRKLLLLAAISATISVKAQEKDTAAVLTDLQLQPIEVRAIRAGGKSPFAAVEVDKKEIRKNNLGQDIPYLLQFTPSAVVTSDAGAGVGYTGLRIRGTDGTRINVTLNGIPVNDAESQGTFFVNFGDLASSVNSIQIQRGVGTSTNGPGAFGATMSIANLELSEQPGAALMISAGSFNTQKYTLKAATGLLAGGWQFDARLSKISSLGFIDRSASDLKSLQLNAGWKASAKTSLRMMLMTGRERTGQAWNGVPEEKLRGSGEDLLNHYYNNVGVLYFTPQDSVNLFSSDPRRYNSFTYSGQTDNYQQDYYQLFLDHRFSAFWTASIAGYLTRGKGYYEEYKYGESLEAYGLAPFTTPAADTLETTDLIRQLWLDNYYYGTVFSLMYTGNATRLTFGGGATRYDGDHYGFVKWAQFGVPADHRWYLLPASKTDLNGYAKAEHTWKRLTLFGDLQLRHVDYNINGFRKNPGLRSQADYLFFNPKAGLSYQLPGGNRIHQRLYASLAVANKEPNRDDFEAGATQMPRPERLYDAEAGYELKRTDWNIAANLYYMKYTDQLVLTGKVNDVGAYTRTNVPESYRMGLELIAGARPLSWLALEANATFSQNKIINFVEYMDNYDDYTQVAVNHGTTDIAFSPSEVVAAMARFSPPLGLPAGHRFEADLLGKYVGRQFLDNTGNVRRSIDAYALADIRFRYTLTTRALKEVGLSVQLNNILNRKYESNGYTYSYIYGGSTTTQNFYYPQAGFNWLAGVTLQW